MEPISVMLIDDNQMFLHGTSEFLSTDERVVVVGTLRDGREALARISELRPQIILIDLAMPEMSGFEAIPLLRNAAPGVKIIALTAMNSDHFRQAAMKAGADAFLPKAQMRTELLPTIQRFAQANDVSKVAETPLPGSSTPPSVLVMEDDDQLRRLYCKTLEKSGYQVYDAATVEDARQILDQVPVAIFFCDINMGGQRGTDLLRDYANELFTSGAHVVMISGESRYREICEEMGADFFLEKPVAMSTLLALADRLTARHAL
ncbi:MAG: response regulator [Anaerolineae bacterium]|nr:response regulator [Anaerolineae bacterium]